MSANRAIFVPCTADVRQLVLLTARCFILRSSHVHGRHRKAVCNEGLHRNHQNLLFIPFNLRTYLFLPDVDKSDRSSQRSNGSAPVTAWQNHYCSPKGRIQGRGCRQGGWISLPGLKGCLPRPQAVQMHLRKSPRGMQSCTSALYLSCHYGSHCVLQQQDCKADRTHRLVSKALVFDAGNRT